MKIILGSASPRRKEILQMVGLDFEVDVINTVEDIKDSDPVNYVKRTAFKKGEATSFVHPNDLVIAADTIVVCDDEVLEKPKDELDAYRMIDKIQGRRHFVYTAVYICYNNVIDVFVEETKVYVQKMSAKEISDYVKTDEAYDKAGAYAIQGKFAKYITKINGDYYNVMGLPLCKVYNKLHKILKKGVID